MAITVVPPTIDDKDQWEILYRGYADFYNVPMDGKILSTVWHWIHDASNPFFCVVAKDDENQLLGLMHFRAMPSPLRGTMVGFLDDLYVKLECRGSGVVAMLYAGLEKSAKEQGWPLVRWKTADNNYRARSVYDQLSTKTHWVTYQMDL